MTIAERVRLGGSRWGLPLHEARPAPQGRERREAERAIAYWDEKVDAMGEHATLAALDLAAITGCDWAHRFVIAVDQRVQASMLLLYGSVFGKLLRLPDKPNPRQPLLRQLPQYYEDVFVHGCSEAQWTMQPVRLEGDVQRDDDRVEQYRAAFIPVRVKPNALTCFAFGAFNSRLLEPTIAA